MPKKGQQTVPGTQWAPRSTTAVSCLRRASAGQTGHQPGTVWKPRFRPPPPHTPLQEKSGPRRVLPGDPGSDLPPEDHATVKAKMEVSETPDRHFPFRRGVSERLA